MAKEAAQLLLNPRFIGPCLAGVFCMTVATVVGVTYLFTIATALLALPLASYFVGSFAMRGYNCTREQSVVATQGERAVEVLRIRGPKNHAAPGLVIRDKLPGSVEACIPDGVEIPQDEETDVCLWIEPKKRGVYVLGPAEISGSDPLGMFRLKRKVGDTAELVVYPKPVPIRMDQLTGGAGEAGTTIVSGKAAPRGDFAGVRDYRVGDELKRVHWKTTARTQKLAVIECEDSVQESVTIALDLSRGADFGKGTVTSLDTATGAAAYAIRGYLKAGRNVHVVIPNGAQVDSLHLSRLDELPLALAALARAEADSAVSSADLLRRCTDRNSVLLITTRSDEGLVSAVREATSRRVRVYIALIDPSQFDARTVAGPMVTDLTQAGARVEVVREVARR